MPACALLYGGDGMQGDGETVDDVAAYVGQARFFPDEVSRAGEPVAQGDGGYADAVVGVDCVGRGVGDFVKPDVELCSGGVEVDEWLEDFL